MQRHAVASGVPRKPRRACARPTACLMMLWLLSVVLLPSCSSWKESFNEPLQLPAQRLAPDTVGLEITFVRVPAGQLDLNEQIWQHVDEQCVDAQARMDLNRNGFRTGLVGSQLPDPLRRLLDEQKQQNGLDQLISSQTDVLAQNRQLQSRSGQRSEIVAGPPQPEIVVLKSPKQGKVEGRPFSDAQCILATRCFPQSDGGVQLELIPEVHHGSPKKQWVAGEGTFHMLSGREREVFADLKMLLTLSPGQTVVLSCTSDEKGLGQNFFVESGRGAAQQKFFLIRLSQTQKDELFDGPTKSKLTGI
jgi:hypothetical protein